jgi:hypothetical protein
LFQTRTKLINVYNWKQNEEEEEEEKNMYNTPIFDIDAIYSEEDILFSSINNH